MNMRKILAAMLVVVMVLAMVPVTAQAAEFNVVDDTIYEAGKLYLDKTATLEDDGTYTIKMEAFATGTVTIEKVITGTPLDVVLVIDQSGSIYNAGNCEKVEEAIRSFLEQLTENGKTIGKTHRVAVAGFACSEWETGVTHSFGNTASNTANSWITDLPVVDGSYAQLWTNTGIFLNDGTFKNYQTFEFEEVPAPTPGWERTDMVVGTYKDSALSNQNWTNVTGFFTADGEQIQVRTSRNWEGILFLGGHYEYTYYFRTANGTSLSFTVTDNANKNSDTASVNGQETYVWNDGSDRMPVVTNNSDPYHVIYGTYTHPVTDAGPENREFPVYFVDDTETWPGKTVRRAIYRTTSGDFYYDFRTEGGFNNNTRVPKAPVPDMDTRKVYKIKYDYNTQTGEFNGGYLTEADYQQTFMNVTDGEAGSGNLNAALDKIASGLGSSGGTRTGTGMEMARKILECNPLTDADRDEGRERVVIVFTDGVPGQDPFEIDEANAALAESAKIKDMVGTNKNVVVYSLGLFKENVAASADANTFMNALSSNYPDADSMDDVSSTTTEDGEYYSKTTNPENLWQLFPTIVTEDTTTTMESVYLTEGSILRDILGAGFLLSDETDIDVTTLAGQWVSIPDTDNKQGHIAWSDEGPQYFAHKHDFKPAELPRPEITETIQIYNTNPNPGGNFYETASGEPNLAAPPTIDITNFNYQEEYFAFDHNGRKIMVTITGLEAQPDTVGYGANNLTNHEQSGLWAPMKEDRTRELVEKFPVPNTTFTEGLYVLDYAKPMNIPLSDLKMFKADSLDEDAMNYFNPAVPKITEANGNVVLENGKLVYKPMTTTWDGYDTFYVFGESELSTITDYSSNRNGNLWSRVKVLPANNVYYEDTFIESKDGVSTGGVTVGIEYSGGWTYAEEGENKELPEVGETNYGESPYEGDMPFGGVHGWEDYLADDTGYSDGGATSSSANGATASFTFTGTGVDIYSYTDLKQGAVMANIYAGTEAKGKALYSCIMDNFSLSGDYYQIPTLSLHEKYLRDENGALVKDENGVNELTDLGFGTYTVKLTVMAKTDDADGDGEQTTRCSYVLDGIRIYNPIQNLEGDETVQQAYGEEELNASFVEVRDILLDAKSFDVDVDDIDGDGVSDTLGYGVVFLDQVPDFDGENDSGDGQTGVETKDVIGEYKCYGPKNEVYLAMGQSVAFVPKSGYHYYVGLKSPTGETVCVGIAKDGNSELLTIDHTTDLYYEITPEDGIVLIENSGFDKDFNEYNNLLSVTKIKVTGPDGSEVEPAEFFEPVDQPTVLRMVRTLRQEAAAPEEPEVPETDPTEPSAPDVEIENPTEPTEPETPEADGSNHLWQLIGGVIGWIIGNIFG